MKFDFISIGDTVSDEFIKLKDVRLDTDPDEGDKGYDEICFRFGDKVEFDSAVLVPAVGNAANAAVSAARLGLNTAFITDFGDDELGDTKLETLKKEGIDPRWIKQHEGMQSNHHYVLRWEAERTILIKHHKYPYEVPEDLEEPKWFYFSSVGEHGLEYHNEIARYLEDHPEVKFAFQPGTFQISLGAEKIKEIYENTELFFCNKEEAQLILDTKEDDIKKLLSGIRELGPNISVITDGPEGAYTFDGEEVWHMPMYPDPAPPVDRTGAGDAFSSTLTAALASGHDIPTALSWGPINSMSVVQYIGAQEGLLTREKLEEYLEDAPEDYSARQM